MKRIIVKCPCGTSVIWTEDIDDGKDKFTVQEGIGDTQPCCESKMNPKQSKGDYMFEHAMSSVTPLKKDKRK